MPLTLLEATSLLGEVSTELVRIHPDVIDVQVYGK
jgi:hypothetical protein